MTTIFERVETALATLSPVPVSLAPYKGTLPDLYIVHQLITGNPEQHADDSETKRTFTVQVTIWNKAGLASLPDVPTAMLNAGFMKGPERQLPQDDQTHHYGWSMDFVYVEST